MRCNEIHPLEVAYLGIALDEAEENVAELGLQLVSHLGVLNVGIRAYDVDLHLMEVRVGVKDSLAVFKLVVVAWVCLYLAQSSCSLQPNQRVNLVLTLHNFCKRVKERSVSQKGEDKDALANVEVLDAP